MTFPMKPKITLIGAGSVVFAKTLIGDILQRPELSQSTICLMDIDPARLKVAEVMAKKMAAAIGAKPRIEATLDRRKAVRNANYVICTIQVGGYKPGTVIDFEIPKKYGLKQTIADTLGVGGIFRALRTIPEINAIGRDMAEVAAANCLLLNYTNPMAMNCWAFDREIGLPHVGLCHSVQGTSQQLARYAGLAYDDVDYLVAGINHVAFFLKFAYQGQDAYPLLFRALNRQYIVAQDRVRFEMMRRLGYFITESSEHLSEYVPYFIHHGKKVIDAFDIPIDEYIRRCEVVIRSWKDSEKKLLGEDGAISYEPASHEYGAQIIHARETGQPAVVYGNVPNRGLITNLPDGCCVEVPCLVDAQGLQPTVIGELPPQCAALCGTNVNAQSLAVEAALTKQREAIYHAVMLDPHTASTLTTDKIWAMCDEMIAAHQKVGLLGEFKPVISGTGRPLSAGGQTVIAEIDSALKPGRLAEGEIAVELVVTNPRKKALKLSLDLSCDDPKARIKGSRRLAVVVPAGRSVRRRIVISGVQTDGARIRVCTNEKNVFCKDMVLRKRALFDATGKKGGELKMQLAGFPAVEGTFTATSKEVVLDACVADSKPDATPHPTEPSRGTGMELFLSDALGKTIRQLCVVPRPGRRTPLVCGPSGVTVSGATATQKVQAGNYSIKLKLDRAALKLTQETVLFDVIVRLGALGDAHSGGRTALGGSFQSWSTTTHYAELRLPKG